MRIDDGKVSMTAKFQRQLWNFRSMGPATDVPHLEIGNFGCLRYRVSRTDFEFDESLLISSQVTETALFSDTPKPSNSCPLPFSICFYFM